MMKKTLLLAGLAVMAVTGASAQLVDFTAENIPNTTGTTVASTNGAAGPFAAEINNLASGATAQVTGLHATAATVYSTPSGNGSAKSLSANNWSVGDYFQFALSNTTGVSVRSVNFVAFSSGTGPGSFNFQYSINNAAYVTFSTYTVGTTTLSPTTATTADTISISFDTATSTLLSNSAVPISFRLTDASTLTTTGTTVAAGGTSRFDDFTVVPEPGTWVTIALGGVALLFIQRRRKQACAA